MPIVTDREGAFYHLSTDALNGAGAADPAVATVVDAAGRGYSVPPDALTGCRIPDELFEVLEADVVGQSYFDDQQMALLDQLARDQDIGSAGSVGLFRDSFSAVRSSFWPD